MTHSIIYILLSNITLFYSFVIFDTLPYLCHTLLFMSSSLLYDCRPMSLSLENPDDCDVDIGRNSFQMQKIRRAFEHGQQVHGQSCVVLCCIVLCRLVLCCIVSSCVVLCCIILCCVVLCCVVSSCVVSKIFLVYSITL